MTPPKKPPDKYRTTKCAFRSISNNNEVTSRIFDAMFRTHLIVIHTYQFLRLWILDKYHSNSVIPLIDKELIKMAFKALMKPPKQGRPPADDNSLLYKNFLIFHENNYKELGLHTKLDGINLSQILSYMAIDMVTNIENNIKLKFIQYVKRFVNSSFKKQNSDILDQLEGKEKKKMRKTLNNDLYNIKEDLFNRTLKSDNKYHEWINTHHPHIFPKEFTDSYEFDVQHNPQNYIKCMIYMCLQIEKSGTKLFQFFPLRNNIIPKYIPIDTTTLVDLLVDEGKKDYKKNIGNIKDQIWRDHFNLDYMVKKSSIFNQPNYKFDYSISTDCMAVSIRLIHKDFIEDQTEIKNKMKEANDKERALCKDMTPEEKKAHKTAIKQKKHDDLIKNKLEKKLKADKEKEAFKKLSKEEKKQIIAERKQKQKDKPTKYIEFPYLEDLNDEQYKELQDTDDWGVNDPGRRYLMVIKSKKGVVFRYSNRKHLSRTKRLKYAKLIKNRKDKEGISTIENELSTYNSKSCVLEEFKKFIMNKNRVNALLLEKYMDETYRKYKWYSYINRKKAETKLVKEIRKIYGKNFIIINGDWSSKMNTNYMTTPNMALKRKIAEYFKSYNLDEFRTSCLNYKTETRCKNLYLPDKKGKERKKHSILTYETESNRKGCINRDLNAVNNMIKIVLSYLHNKTRPEKYRRDYKFPEKIKTK